MITFRKILIAGVSAVTILIIVLAVRASASANITADKNINNNSARQTAIMQAIQNNDYKAWFAAMTQNGNKPQIVDKINAGNFSKYTEMIGDFKNGKFEDVKKISEQLGISNLQTLNQNSNANEGTRGDFKDSPVMQAIQNKDYNAWVAALNANGSKPKILDKINADNFGKFTEMLQLMKDGKNSEADSMRKELGLPAPNMGAQNGSSSNQ